MELTRHRFLFLTFAAHVMFLGLVFTGSRWEWACAVGLFVLLTLVSTAFYHRLLSHRSWECPLWVQKIGIVFGVLSLTGTPLTRTAVHRQHHAKADTILDPHSPAYRSLLEIYLPQTREYKLNLTLVKDILRTPWLMKVHEHYLSIILGLVLVLPFRWVVVWGAAATLVWLNIFLCNYFCHWGGRLHDNRWMGLLTFGEGHHRHHHVSPDDVRFGVWDPGYWFIRWVQAVTI